MSAVDASTINTLTSDLKLVNVPTPQLVALSTSLHDCLPVATADGAEAIKRITGRINAVLKSRAIGAPATRKDK